MFKFLQKRKRKSGDGPVTGAKISKSALGGNATGHLDLPSSFEIVAAIQTDVGCHRELNEDSGTVIQPGDSELLAEKGRLAIVADGMGGHSAGEVASLMAVQVISRVYYDDPGEPVEALRNAFRQANQEIHESSLRDEAKSGMGTTCTALVLRNGSALAAHVGDSRLYLIRNNQIYLMTEDHSAVMEMVKRGMLTLEEARHHPDKNVILRALGSHPEVEVTIWEEPFPAKESDSFLLCSDGLYDLVEDHEILETVLAESAESACNRLIALAKERGGYDNITVAIMSVRGATEETVKGFDEKKAASVPATRELLAGQGSDSGGA